MGRQWQGWMALSRDDLDAAARRFRRPDPRPGRHGWRAGRRSAAGGIREAADAYQRAVAAWEAERREPPRPLLDRIAPPADLGLAYTELGGARLLAGDAAGAIAALRLALKESPASARAMFLRARAEEAAGDTDAALADYNLASRTAFANAAGLASGEAHLYRGILLYRRKEYRARKTSL